MQLKNTNSILYVGASVTAQKDGYRQYLTEQINEHCGTPVTEQVVATGATGSLFGICNMANMSLTKYDLCFFEYSTGDLNLWLTPKHLLKEIVYEFIEQLKSIAKNVVVIHNYRSDFEGDKGDVVRHVYDQVALELGVPVFDIYKSIEQLKSKIPESEWTDYYRDSVHTNEKGARAVASEIFTRLIDLPLVNTELQDDPMASAKTVSICDFVSSDKSYIYPGSQQQFPFVDIEHSVNKLEVTLKGEIWGVVPIVGPKSGWLRVSTSEDTIAHFNMFDRHCYYTRVQPRVFQNIFNEFTKVTFEVTDEEIDASIVTKPMDEHMVQPRQGALSMLMGRNLEIQQAQLVS